MTKDRLRRDLMPKTFANLVARDLQKLRRLEEADDEGMCQCCSCATVAHYKQMQGGHFIATRSPSVLLVEHNIHPQCIRCNRYLAGNQVHYEEYMRERYGDAVVAELKALRDRKGVFAREVLADLRDEYNARIKQELARLDKQGAKKKEPAS